MAAVDPSDHDPQRRQPASYAGALAGSSLRGARIGVLRTVGSSATHPTVPDYAALALPLSVEFFGRAWDESRLLRIAYAYAYEQHTHHR
jgi:Asp-tRNA(Asn)/Glu-tRNA(Gln) amidotransferase A subunit family amidase